MRITLVTAEDGSTRRRVSFGNLLRCGSVWCCPHDAVVVAAKRQQEIKAITRTWMAGGGAVLFLTLTMRHQGHERLDDLWDSLQSAWQKVQLGGAYKYMTRKLGQVGFIRATEVTYGEPALGGKGWHVHLHVLLYLMTPVEEQEHVENLRRRIFADWAGALSKLGLETPALDKPNGKPLGADLRVIDRLNGIDGYFKKNAYLSSVDAISYELSAGNTSKKGRGVGKRNRTPLQLFQALIEDQQDRGKRIWFDLPGRKDDPRAKVTFEGDKKFLLHNPNKVGEILHDDGLNRTYFDSATGQTWMRDEVVTEDLPQLTRHAAWFEFQTVVFGYRNGQKTKQNRRQITKASRKSGAAAETVGGQLWNKALDAMGEELTDEEIVQQDMGGVDHVLITKQSWKNILAGDNEAQVELQEALETSDSTAQEVADKLGVTLTFVRDEQPDDNKLSKSDRQRHNALRDIDASKNAGRLDGQSEYRPKRTGPKPKRLRASEIVD